MTTTPLKRESWFQRVIIKDWARTYDESNNPAYKLFWETIANPCNKGFAVNRWSMFGHGNSSIYLNSYTIDPLAIGESCLELIKPLEKLCEFIF
ncbi:hypothetical protein QUA54_16965 [Microcoleus sp. MOSTC5]|uniref:hypothetical protein n=1 Tax=Microcoleus sp. MOSTC5 TaxID=3055378 RepID=UPI002FCFE1C3